MNPSPNGPPVAVQARLDCVGQGVGLGVRVARAVDLHEVPARAPKRPVSCACAAS